MAQDWRRAVLRQMGAPITTRNLQFLTSWQRWEGGHTNNDARYNWLNTTKTAPGVTGSINSVGVKAFDSFDNGVAATIATLQNGRYDDIVAGLRSGDPYKAKPTAGLSTWVSGSPTGNLGYSAKVLGLKPEDVKAQASQAYQAGPAAVVNGPSPVQALAYQQQRSAAFLAMANNSFRGDFGANMQIVQGLKLAQQQLAAANAQVQAAEYEARQTGGTTAPAGGTGRTFEGVSGQLQKILQVVDAQVGKPYVFGAESPEEGGFDCSGLIDYAFKQAGIRLPGRLTTMTAAKMGVSVKGQPLKPGDWLVRNGGPGGGHMVMYVGNGQVIAAPQTGSRVQYQDVSRFTGPGWDVRRVLK